MNSEWVELRALLDRVVLEVPELVPDLVAAVRDRVPIRRVWGWRRG